MIKIQSGFANPPVLPVLEKRPLPKCHLHIIIVVRLFAGPIKDRFTPSEAVASHQIKANSHNHGHHHNHAPTYTAVGKSPAASNVVNTYVPPKNLYSFPPNNIDYPLPTQDNKLAVPSSIINSYSPPPSGSTDGGYKYAGPLNLGYLPSINNSGDGNGDDGTQDQQKDNGNDDSDTGNGDMDDSIGVLPASAMGGDNNGGMDTMDQMMPTKDGKCIFKSTSKLMFSN